MSGITCAKKIHKSECVLLRDFYTGNNLVLKKSFYVDYD